MATIIYLDVEDEITSAAARIRSAGDPRVALVLPFGSRLATSRINFRLLAREATVNGRRLDIVAPDASARALAASAGLAVFGSVGEYEEALEGGGEDDSGDGAGDGRPDEGPDQAVGAASIATGPARGGREAARGPDTSGGQRPGDHGSGGGRRMPRETPAEPVSGGAGAVAVRGEPRILRPARSLRSLRPGTPALVGGGILALALIVTGVAAWLLLPSAVITVTPRVETIGPISLEVLADPSVTVVDEFAAVIPAVTVSIPLRATGEFPATGTRVEETKATGTVRFESINTVGDIPIPRGTRVATLDAVVFVTTSSVVVPRAQVAGNQIERGRVDAPVEALKSGPGGNVDAGSITQVSAALQGQQISVGNPAATSGGRHDEFPQVTQKDVDAALTDLRAQLDEQLASALENPVGVPLGATVFPETLTRDEPATDVDPATLVGLEVETFPLQMAGTGQVLAVDPAPVETIARSRLLASVDPGHQLVDGSVEIELGEATVRGATISFPVSGTARQIRPVDAAALKADILGLAREDAQRLLEQYGVAEVTLWPDWVSAVPTIAQRVELTVEAPIEPSPSPPPSPSPSPASSSPSPPASAEPSGNASGDEPLPSG
jgi:hypothetical protein